MARQSNPLKMQNQKVHYAVNKAIRHGILTVNSCESCGTGQSKDSYARSVQAHHDDYNKPFCIRWLCTSCHAEWHFRNKATQLTQENQRLTSGEYYKLGLSQVPIEVLQEEIFAAHCVAEILLQCLQG